LKLEGTGCMAWCLVLAAVAWLILFGERRAGLRADIPTLGMIDRRCLMTKDYELSVDERIFPLHAVLFLCPSTISYCATVSLRASLSCWRPSSRTRSFILHSGLYWYGYIRIAFGLILNGIVSFRLV
jgi:hypothetical protein